MKYVTRTELSQNLASAADYGEQGGEADLIEEIQSLLSGAPKTPHRLAHDDCHKPSTQSLAGKLYSSRREIDLKFGMDGFSSSPAWDIMLDLIYSEQKGRTVSITSACIGAACPTTTALRWLRMLVRMALIERHEDPKDKRRSYVILTPKGRGTTLEALRAHI